MRPSLFRLVARSGRQGPNEFGGYPISAAIGNSGLSAEDKAKVKSLSDKGFAQHKTGDHRASVKALAEAMRMLVGGMK